MGSILSNPLPSPQTTTDQNLGTGISKVINQILGSVNPQETFNQLLANNQEAKTAMDNINRYGNGDPKQAFINMMAQNGKQSLGQEIMQKLNLRL